MICVFHFLFPSLALVATRAISFQSLLLLLCVGSWYCLCTGSSCCSANPFGFWGWDVCCAYRTGRSSNHQLLYLYNVENYLTVLIRWGNLWKFSTPITFLTLKYIQIVWKVRVPVGRLILELPAGMLDDDHGDFAGTAVREVSLSSLSKHYPLPHPK